MNDAVKARIDSRIASLDMCIAACGLKTDTAYYLALIGERAFLMSLLAASQEQAND